MTEKKTTTKKKTTTAKGSQKPQSSKKKKSSSQNKDNPRNSRPPRSRRSGPSKSLREARKKNEELVPRNCTPSMLKHLETSLDDGPFVVFDIETTGGNPGRNGITEIFALRYYRGEIQDTFYSLVNPEIPIPPIVRRMTGITNSTVKDAPKIEEVMPKVLDFIKTDILVSHNTIGDLKFIRYFADSVCKKRLQNFFMCTHLLTEKLAPDAPDKSLQGLSKYFKLDAGTLHRAEADTYLTLELFKVLLGRLKNRGIQRILEGVRYQGDYESGMRLGWGVDSAAVRALPKGPGVFYLYDHERKLLFLSSALNIGRDVKKLERYLQLPRQLLRIVLQTYDVKYERCPSVFAAVLKEGEEVSYYKPGFDPSNWHQRSVQTIYIAEDGDSLRVGLGSMAEGTKHAFGPLRDRKAGGNLLQRVATTLGLKYSRKGFLIPVSLEPVVVAFFKDELTKTLADVQASIFSLSMLFRPQERKQRKELIEKIQALMEVKNKMNLEPLLEMAGLVIVPDEGQANWAVYSITASSPMQLPSIQGNPEEKLAEAGLGNRIKRKIASDMAKHKPTPLTSDELARTNGFLWWLTSTAQNREGQFISLDQMNKKESPSS